MAGTWRFKLTTLFAILTLVAVGAGLKAYKANEAREFKKSAARLGGVVAYDHEKVGGDLKIVAAPRVPPVLDGVVDEMWFANPQVLYLHCQPVTDDDLEFLKHAPHLPALDLSGTQITDGAMKHVAMLKDLKTLLIYNTQITDDGVVQLKGLTKLQVLDLRNTHISDRGLQHLMQIASLEYLYLTGTDVTTDAVVDFQLERPHCQVEYIAF